MGKEEEIMDLMEELEEPRIAYAIEIPLMLQREDKRMYERILKDKEEKRKKRKKQGPSQRYTT